MNIDSTITNQHLSSLPAVEQLKERKNSGLASHYPQAEKVERSVVSESNETPNLQVKDVENLNRSTVSKEQLEVLAEKLQDFVSSLNKGLQFSVHEESGRDVIKVIDRESDEVVRQYPSEEVLELVAKLSDAAGNFVNSKV